MPTLNDLDSAIRTRYRESGPYLLPSVLEGEAAYVTFIRHTVFCKDHLYNDRNFDIVLRRFGLVHYSSQTYSTIAQTYQITTTRAREIVEKILRTARRRYQQKLSICRYYPSTAVYHQSRMIIIRSSENGSEIVVMKRLEGTSYGFEQRLLVLGDGEKGLADSPFIKGNELDISDIQTAISDTNLPFSYTFDPTNDTIIVEVSKEDQPYRLTYQYNRYRYQWTCY